jgi:hypothetical protein
MTDKDMIIREYENWIKNHRGEQLILEYTAVEDLLALLKEQDELGTELTNAVELIRKKNERIEKLLKEQEPKVLTVDQLEDALDTVVWLETPVSENLADGYSLIMAYSHKYGYIIVDSPFGDNPSQDRLEYWEYGRSWRCWDKRPTEEQRQVVKWK